ncbi:MAG TPA: transposase [Anaerolineae bacterium]|nr:transposase [Anaerolineae bacterium]
MKHDPEKRHRRSIRMRGYDYTEPGAYFVTICTQNRECLFGDVVDSEMVLNDAGRLVQSVWDAIPDHYPGVDVDTFVIMPNHIHGIIELAPVGARPRACPGDRRGCRVDKGQPHDGDGQPRDDDGQPHDGDGQPQGVAPTERPGIAHSDALKRMSLPDVVHRFKSLTTARYRHAVHQHGWPPFPGRVWQRNYYEHVIRSERALLCVREYTMNNPSRWAIDIDNPDAWQSGVTVAVGARHASLWREP